MPLRFDPTTGIWNTRESCFKGRNWLSSILLKKRQLQAGNDTLKRMITLHGVPDHYNGVILSAMASQITSVSIACSTVGSGADQRKHQSLASLAIVWGIHRWQVNSPDKSPVTRKMFPFDDVIMYHDIWRRVRYLLIAITTNCSHLLMWSIYPTKHPIICRCQECMGGFCSQSWFNIKNRAICIGSTD